MADSKAGGNAGSGPLVTIIIPCWNGEAYLAEAISSAVSQTHLRTEIIFIDDGSSDGSLEIAKRFPQVRVFSQENAGVSIARNVGLSKASGDFIVFLDADDRLDPDAVEAHLKAFERSDAMPMVYGVNRVIDPEGYVIEQNPDHTREFDWKNVLMGTTPTPSQAMFRRTSLISVGAFNPEIKLGEDFDLYLRLSRLSECYCHGKVISDYRRHPLQATKKPSSSLSSMLGVIDLFQNSFSSSERADEIWRQSRLHWKTYFGQYIPFEVAKSALRLDWTRCANALGIFVRYLPHTAIGSIKYLAARARAR